MESNDNKFGDTIQMPKPEFENWSIAVVYDNGRDSAYAEICSYLEEMFGESGGHIDLGTTEDNNRFFIEFTVFTSEEP